jgi:type I restriction enzyme, S subunit
MKDELWDLPSGWRWEKLGDVADIFSGVALPPIFQNQETRAGNQYPFFKVSSLNNTSEILVASELTFNEDERIKLKLKLLPLGATIFPKRGGAILTNKKRILGTMGSMDSNLMGVKPKHTDLSDYFLYYFFRGLDLTKRMDDSTIPQINNKHIAPIPIAVPPPKEQERIVAKLDMLFARIDQAISLLEENLRLNEQLVASVLDDVFQSAAEKWGMMPLEEFTSKIGSGATPKGGQSVYKPSGICLIRSMNIYDSGFDSDGLAFIDEIQAKELDNVQVQSRDVLLNITGASVARCCVVPEEFLPARVNQHVMIIRPKQDDLRSEFLQRYLISPGTKASLLFTSGGGATREALTKKMVQDLLVPLPLPAEQDRISNYLSFIQNKVGNIRNSTEVNITQLRSLKSSLLDRAFRGEL